MNVKSIYIFQLYCEIKITLLCLQTEFLALTVHVLIIIHYVTWFY